MIRFAPLIPTPAGLWAVVLEVLQPALTDLPPLIKHFADKQELLINASMAVGRLSQSGRPVSFGCPGRSAPDLQAPQWPAWAGPCRAAPYLVGALKLILTQFFGTSTPCRSWCGASHEPTPTLDSTTAPRHVFLTERSLLCVRL